MEKPIRKLTTKKLFGKKVHDEMIIPLQPTMNVGGRTVNLDVTPDKLFFNGNLVRTDSFVEFFKNPKIDWLNSEWNWITYGLFRFDLDVYDFDYLPEDRGYASMKNLVEEIVKDIIGLIKKYNSALDDNFMPESVLNKIGSYQYDYSNLVHPYLVGLYRVNWLEGKCNAAQIIDPENLHGNVIDTLFLSYKVGNDYYKSEFELNPINFICGYEKSSDRTFLCKKELINNEYNSIEIITQGIGKYLILTNEKDKEIAIKLNSRYKKQFESLPIKSIAINVFNKIKNKYNEDNDYRIKSDDELLNYIIEEYNEVKELCRPIFSYTIFPSHEDVSIPWESIRSDYEKQGFIKVGKPFNLCGHLDIKEVKSIRIADEFDYIPDLNTSLTLNQKLGFNEDITINLSFDLKEDFFVFQELKKDIEINGNFLSNLRDLSDMVSKGFVTGYDTIFELKAFFDNQGKIDSSKENVSEKVTYLKTIKNVLIDNITDGNIKQQVIDIVKSLIHSSSNTSQNINTTNLKTIDIDFSKDPRIGISSKVEFLVLSEEDQNQLNRFLKEVETGEFYSNLVRIKKLVTNSYITGFYDRLELKDYFGEQGGIEPDNDDVKKSLNYLSDLSNQIIPKIKESMIADALKSIIKLTING